MKEKMKKEDGKTPLATLVTLAIAIIICGVIIAMIYEKPSKVEENNINTKTTNVQENNEQTNETNESNNIN